MGGFAHSYFGTGWSPPGDDYPNGAPPGGKYLTNIPTHDPPPEPEPGAGLPVIPRVFYVGFCSADFYTDDGREPLIGDQARQEIDGRVFSLLPTRWAYSFTRIMPNVDGEDTYDGRFYVQRSYIHLANAYQLSELRLIYHAASAIQSVGMHHILYAYTAPSIGSDILGWENTMTVEAGLPPEGPPPEGPWVDVSSLIPGSGDLWIAAISQYDFDDDFTDPQSAENGSATSLRIILF